MDASGLKKLLIVVALGLVALPIVPKILPKPLTFDRFESGFKAAGLTVAQFDEVSPALESVAQISATVNDAMVNIYQYDNEGKIAKQFEYQKQDPGSAIVQTWGLAQSLGAAVPKQQPTRAGRRGMFMIVATGPDVEVLKRIVEAFDNS